jgi:hypothetical protein
MLWFLSLTAKKLLVILYFCFLKICNSALLTTIFQNSVWGISLTYHVLIKVNIFSNISYIYSDIMWNMMQILKMDCSIKFQNPILAFFSQVSHYNPYNPQQNENIHYIFLK